MTLTKPLTPDLSSYTRRLQSIWDKQWFTNHGDQHDELEEALSYHLNVPYLSLFNNGTIALIVAIKSLRLSGEVITTPFTFAATPHVLTWNNIRPVFCDICDDDMTIDPNCIENLITPDTTGILAVHVYGNPCSVHQIQEIADRYGLKVIYDAAHAFGTSVDGKGIGRYGDISMFSFHATKLFHTAEGGCLTTNDPNLKKRIDFLCNFGIENEETVVMPGINGKMNELQAALGLEILPLLEDEIKKRKKIRELYCKYLSPHVGIVASRNEQYFIIRTKVRDLIYDALKTQGILARKYFYPLCSEFPCYSHYQSARNVPVAEKVSKEVLALPFYGDLEESTIKETCKIIIRFSTSTGD